MTRLALILVLALAITGCAPTLSSERYHTKPLRGQSSTRILVDQDDCNTSGFYPACMVARGYEAEMPLGFRANEPKEGEKPSKLAAPRVVRRPFLISAERPIERHEVVDALSGCETQTAAALSEIKHRISVADAFIGAGAIGLGAALLLPWAVFDEARVHRIIDRVFPLCMARAGLAVRPYNAAEAQR
jgi:hypothetical protein